MEEKEKKTKKKKKKDSKSSPDISFKPSSDVKGLKFGGQIIVKSFTIRRARTLELLKLLSLPCSSSPPLLSTAAYLPTNFTILAHHAWHTLTLGLGTKKSKVVVFVFESEAMRTAVAAEGGIWPPEIPLGDVNKKMIRRLKNWEMARFKFRKGCITFYVYAVRNAGNEGFAAAEDLKKLAIYEAGNDTESESGEEEIEFQLSDRVYVQESLVSLKLAGWDIRLGSEVTVLLPVLRKLCLDFIILVDNPTFVTMIGSCPLLEELAMVDIVWHAWESCFVASSSLKSLKITLTRSRPGSIIITLCQSYEFFNLWAVRHEL